MAGCEATGVGRFIMKFKPMIGKYEVPGIQRIGIVDNRHLVELPVPGLGESYHHDLGSTSISLRIEGTLTGNKEKNKFLHEVRDKFKTGEPIDFVADITQSEEPEKVLISDLKITEVDGSNVTFRYSITLMQYVEPLAASDFGFDDLTDSNLDINHETGKLFDVLRIPDLLGSIPEFKDPTPPLRAKVDRIKNRH